MVCMRIEDEGNGPARYESPGRFNNAGTEMALKISILSSSDLSGGAARAAYRLHDGLRRQGVVTRMFVQSKGSDDRDVVGPSTKFERVASRARADIDLVRQVYHQLYRTNSVIRVALESIAQEYGANPIIAEIVEFARHSKRGIMSQSGHEDD